MKTAAKFGISAAWAKLRWLGCTASLVIAGCTFEVQGDRAPAPAPAPAETNKTPENASCRLEDGALREQRTIATSLPSAYALVGATAATGAFAVGGEQAIALFTPTPDGPQLDSVITGVVNPTAYAPGTGCAVAYAANASRLAFGTTDGSIAVWDTTAHKVMTRLESNGSAVRALALTDDGALVAVADSSGIVRVLAPDDGSVVQAPQEFLANALTFVPGGSDLIVAGSSFTGWSSINQLQRWSRDQSFALTGQCGAGTVAAVAATPDGANVVAAGDGGIARFETSDLGGTAVHASDDWHEPQALAMSSDGALFVTIGGEGTLRLWRTATMAEIARVDVALQVGVAFDPGGESIVTAGRDGTLHVFGCAP